MLEHGFGSTRNEGKVALVTGGGQWIGRACCLRLAEEGCDVVVNDIVPEKAERVAAEGRALGRRAIAAGCDVMDKEAVNAMCANAISELGHVDILVNNVGGGPKNFPNSFFTSDEETWDYVIAKNLKSTMFCTRALINHMRERRSGKIINMSSGAAVRGCKGEVEYCAAKAAVHGFTVGLSHEIVEYGLRVNTVVVQPCGDDPSKMGTRTITQEELLERDIKRSNIPRWGKPEEIAALVAFLASEEGDFTNGQIYMTGGVSE